MNITPNQSDLPLPIFRC